MNQQIVKINIPHIYLIKINMIKIYVRDRLQRRNTDVVLLNTSVFFKMCQSSFKIISNYKLLKEN